MQSKMMIWGGASILGLSLILAACNPSPNPMVDPIPVITSTTLSINGFTYNPKTSTVKVGSDITFPATADHPLLGIDEGNSNPIAATQTTTPVKVTFTKAGTYKFKCQFHDGLGMNGTVTVTN